MRAIVSQGARSSTVSLDRGTCSTILSGSTRNKLVHALGGRGARSRTLALVASGAGLAVVRGVSLHLKREGASGTCCSRVLSLRTVVVVSTSLLFTRVCIAFQGAVVASRACNTLLLTLSVLVCARGSASFHRARSLEATRAVVAHWAKSSIRGR